MSRWQRWCHHASNVLVGGTGLSYFVLRHLVTAEPTAEDPFAAVSHPLQPDVQHLHILVAPLLVFAVGWTWSTHVAPRLSNPRSNNRSTGMTLLVAFIPMVASGYLLQVAVEPAWRTVFLWAHLGSSGLWLVGYGAHVLWALGKSGTTCWARMFRGNGWSLPRPRRLPSRGESERLATHSQ